MTRLKRQLAAKKRILAGLFVMIFGLCVVSSWATVTFVKPEDASQRISTLFMELLERQFPIDDTHTEIHFRSPSEFAHQLNVHVNHLNRVVKKTLGKTTSQIIAERILQESKILLKHSAWSVSEIAYSLGFTEATHFNNFFKN